MVGSMFAAVAGLKAHQTKLDVIGNNIANVNTWGFKSQLANIEDAVYRTRKSSAGNRGNNGGGNNASQIGYGSNVNYISVNYTTGNWNPTGWGGDCMINGSGFFVVTKNLSNAKGTVSSPAGLIGSEESIQGVTGSINPDGSVASADIPILNADGIQLSRVCMLGIDEAGYLVDQNGYYVLNFRGEAMQVRQSGTIETQANINGDYQFTDADGKPVSQKTAAMGEIFKDNNAKTYLKDDVDEKPVQGEVTHTDGTKETLPAYTNANGATVYFKEAENKYYYVDGKEYTLGTGETPTQQKTYTVDVDGTPINVDPASGTYYQYNEEDTVYNGDASTLKPIMTTMNVTGPFTYDSITIQTDGTITAVIKSPSSCAGKVETLGQLGIASVENVQGLEHDEGYYYNIGANAGDVTVNQTTLATGDVLGGYLEMSNVDLSTEITGLITTQRGYQANTKIITVTDEMLETLVNMKR